MPDEVTGRVIEAALRAVRRMAKPGAEIVITHWSSRTGSGLVVRETA